MEGGGGRGQRKFFVLSIECAASIAFNRVYDPDVTESQEMRCTMNESCPVPFEGSL